MDQLGRLWSAVACFLMGAVVISVAYLSFRFYFPAEPVAVVSPGDSPVVNGGISPAVRPPRNPPGTHVDQVYAQRSQIKQLRTLLDQKTALLEKRTELLNEKTAEQAAIEADLAEAIGLLEMLAVEIAAGRALAADKQKSEQLQAELQRLQGELRKIEASDQSQKGELELLKTELSTTDAQIAVIEQASDSEINALLTKQRQFEQIATNLLVQTGASTVPALSRLLTHPQPEIRVWSARSLGTMGSAASDATPALIDALSDPNLEVQSAARAALTAIESAGN